MSLPMMGATKEDTPESIGVSGVVVKFRVWITADGARLARQNTRLDSAGN